MVNCLVVLNMFISVNVCEIKYTHYNYDVKKYEIKFKSGDEVYIGKVSYKLLLSKIKERNDYVKKTK